MVARIFIKRFEAKAVFADHLFTRPSHQFLDALIDVHNFSRHVDDTDADRSVLDKITIFFFAFLQGRFDYFTFGEFI